MMKDKPEMLDRACEALRTCLADIPSIQVDQIQVEPAGYPARPDLLARLSLPDGQVVIVAEVECNGQPRVARQAVQQISSMTRLFPRSYGVFIAPYISPAAARICAQWDIGYIDLAGNCRLSFWPVYVRQEGNPNPFPAKRDLRSLYSPKAERILRVLLVNPKRTWKTQELADEAGVSIGQVANVKRLLDDREWIRTDRSGFGMADSEALMREWGQEYGFRRNTTFDFYMLGAISQMETRLAEVCTQQGIRYALTGFSGGARYAPAVRYERVTAYVESGAIERVAAALELKKVTSGANLSLMVPYDEGVLYGSQDVGGQCVASPVQVYLDLTSLRGRGEEAAQAVLSGVIRPSWR